MTTTSTPTALDLHTGVESVIAQLGVDGQADDAAKCVSRHSYDILCKAGYLDILAASEFGGLDLRPLHGMRILEQLSRHDTAIAWTTMVTNSHYKDLHFFPLETARQLYADGPPRIAGTGAPTGQAQRTEGGFRVSGRWSYGSAIPFADWVIGGAVVTTEASPEMSASGPNTVMFITPAENVTVEDNWDVLGLQATASYDYSIDDVFVPAEFVCENVFQAEFLWGGRSAALTMPGWLLWDHTSVELGLGRRLLDELATHSQKPAGMRGSLAESPVFQTDFARAEATFRSARAWVYELWQGIEDSLDAGHSPTRTELTEARTAMLHLGDVNESNAGLAFRNGGGATLRSGTFQRVIRDSMASGQHLLMSRSAYTDCGRDYLGMAEGQKWSIYSLA